MPYVFVLDRHADDAVATTSELLFSVALEICKADCVSMRVLLPLLELLWDVEAPFYRIHGIKVDVSRFKKNWSPSEFNTCNQFSTGNRR